MDNTCSMSVLWLLDNGINREVGVKVKNLIPLMYENKGCKKCMFICLYVYMFIIYLFVYYEFKST